MENIVEADPDNWNEEVLKSDVLTAVCFWHERCPLCLRLSPIFSEIVEEYGDRMKFVKLNVLKSPKNQELAAGQGVMGTPTLMFFCQGRSLGQTVSFVQKEELEKVLEDMLGRYRHCLLQSSDLRNYIV